MARLELLLPADERLEPFRGVADPDLVRRRGLFVAEGRRALRTVLRGPYVVEALLLTRAAAEALAADLEGLRREVPCYVVRGPAEVRQVAGHRLHQGALALVRRPPDVDVTALPGFGTDGLRLLVVLERVTDPDNVGAIFRSSAALGADGVVVGPGCAHPLYRKAVRTSLGTTLTLPFASCDSVTALLPRLEGAGYVTFALSPRPEAEEIGDALRAWGPRRAALLLGSEERGLAAETLAAASVVARIRIAGEVDSLNVAAAAAIALDRVGRALPVR